MSQDGQGSCLPYPTDAVHYSYQMSDDPTIPNLDPSDVTQAAVGEAPESLTKPVDDRVGLVQTGSVAGQNEASPPEAEKGMRLEDLPLISGSEPSIERFIEQSFTNPASTRAASQSLVETFDDKGLWLATLIQPMHLASELRQQCSILSPLVLMQWVRQGETQKLKSLSEILLAEPAASRTHESACIMTVLAGVLGILRPSTAQKLINSATPYLSDLEDGGLLRDARQWVEVGRILEGSAPEERVFWNRHLREPGNDWDWNSAEARLALRHLAGKLPREGDILQVFQGAVPGCWWDLWRASPAAVGSGHLALPAPPSGDSRKGRFVMGLLLGMVAALALGGAALSFLPELITPPGPASIQAESHAKSEPDSDADEADAPPAPPIRESLRQLQSVLQKTSPAPVSTRSSLPTTSAANKKEPESASPPPVSGPSKKQIRASTLSQFAAEHDEARRLVSLVKNSSYRENATLIQGGNSVAPKGSPAYQGMIQWLILDPPELADVRLAVTKLALHSLPVDDTIRLFDLCFYPGSPNEIEIKQCASLLLELPDTSITGAHRIILNKIVSAP